MKSAGESRRNFIKKTSLIGAALPLAGITNVVGKDITSLSDTAENLPKPTVGTYTITVVNKKVKIIAGIFTREIDLNNNQIITKNLRIGGTEILSGASTEFQVDFYQAYPNARPVGLKLTDDKKLFWADGTEANKTADNQPVQWKDQVHIDGEKLSGAFKIVSNHITTTKQGVTRLNLRARSLSANTLQGVYIDIFYEVYEGYPAIRKWIAISNNGPQWLKIDKLKIDDIDLAAAYRFPIPLTPEEQGAESSVISFSNKQNTIGIIAASEIPSAPRKIEKNGAMGYTNEFFEWVLGPSETFTSEPVMHFAYSGNVIKTISGYSTPLDRATEGPFKSFLQNCVGLRGNPADLPAPIWCSYSNFLVTLTDADMREQADIAARMGFVTFQLDEGWATTPSPGGSEPWVERFPDFDATCRYIISKGLKLGLWISVFRGPDAKDLVALPNAKSLPVVNNSKRGQGMSLASNWRYYFANDMLYMQDRYGMTYVKQDLTNISKGDVAEGHDSRTLKESILRGLRGLLEINKQLGETSPEMWTQITHEIYWRTPGPPADIAALKHACAFHTTPNTYLGAGNASKRVSQDWDMDPIKLRDALTRSCEQARHRFYDHRGLPVYSIEFYAAHAVNIKGSLTAMVQDRQICSWLMGGPTVFAGDLSSLTTEQVAHYRKRFDLVKKLHSKYNIYSHFQFSGVPVPTDVDWHWWGKLDNDGYGAVIILRGHSGPESRLINIPWVNPKNKYKITAHFANKELGIYTGGQLIKGIVKISLPVMGQDIIELSAVKY